MKVEDFPLPHLIPMFAWLCTHLGVLVRCPLTWFPKKYASLLKILGWEYKTNHSKPYILGGIRYACPHRNHGELPEPEVVVLTASELHFALMEMHNAENLTLQQMFGVWEIPDSPRAAGGGAAERKRQYPDSGKGEGAADRAAERQASPSAAAGGPAAGKQERKANPELQQGAQPVTLESSVGDIKKFLTEWGVEWKAIEKWEFEGPLNEAYKRKKAYEQQHQDSQASGKAKADEEAGAKTKADDEKRAKAEADEQARAKAKEEHERAKAQEEQERAKAQEDKAEQAEAAAKEFVEYVNSGKFKKLCEKGKKEDKAKISGQCNQARRVLHPDKCGHFDAELKQQCEDAFKRMQNDLDEYLIRHEYKNAVQEPDEPPAAGSQKRKPDEPPAGGSQKPHKAPKRDGGSRA